MIKLNELHKYNNKKGVIFLITNTFNNKMFVGVSANSIIDDFNKILEGEEGVLLAGAINKYGKSAFVVEILEENKPDHQLKGFQMYHISRHKSFLESGYGYNNIVKKPLKDDTEQKKEGKYYIIKENEIKLFNTHKEIAEYLNFSVCYIRNILLGKRKSNKYDEIGYCKNGSFEKVVYKGQSDEYFKYKKGEKKKIADKKYNTKVANDIKEANIKKVLEVDLSKWLNKELLREEIEILVDELSLQSTSKKKGKWNTVKKYLILSEKYIVNEKQIMIYGKKFKTIIINLV